MAIEHIFDSASSVMTVISFSTFLGIVLWTFVIKNRADFDSAALLPFADEGADGAPATDSVTRGEGGHV